MSDVFISYSRKDGEFAHKLDAALTREKREVWIDWQDIARGEDWWRSIQTGIDSADTALIVVTENWLVSEVCQRELDYIRQQNKRLFPIIRQKIEGDVAIRVKGTWVDQEWEQRARDNWKYIRSVNWIYFDDDTTFNTALKDLLTALDTDQLYIKSHTRYLVRALEWQQFQRNPSFLLEGDQLKSAHEWLASSANKQPEPHPTHHEYITAGQIAEAARQARDKAREGLIRRFRQTAIGLGLGVVVAIIAAVVIGQQFIAARAEVTRAGATLQQVNLQVTAAINQQSTAAAQVKAADAQVATATIEQGMAVAAQRTSFARENIAGTKIAVAGATLSPVSPTLTAVDAAIKNAEVQQDIANQISNASIMMVDNDLQGALQIMNDAVAAYPNEPLAYVGRGLMLDSLNRPDDAVADYTKAIELDPEDIGAYFNRAGVYRRLGDFDKALEDYTTNIELDPTIPESYFIRAEVYIEINDNDSALADYNHVIQMDPNSVEGYINRGLFYENSGYPNEALQDYQHALKIDPQNGEAHVGIGNFYQNEDKPDEALTEYNRAIELNPQDTIAYLTRADLYLSQEEYDKAIADYQQVIRIDPKYTNAYYNIGSIYFLQGELEFAIEAFTQAISTDATYKIAYHDRAFTYSQMDKVLEASADYWKWIGLNKATTDTAKTVTQAQLPYETTVTMTEGYVYNIPFEAQAGQLLQASASLQSSDSADADALLLVLDPQGKPVMFADNTEESYDAEISDYELPTDGLYTLVVSYGSAGAEGNLDVALDLTSQAEATIDPTPTTAATTKP